MECIEIYLTHPQLLKLAKHQSFQVSPKQFHNKEGKHHIGIVLKKTHHKRFLNNLKNNKGFRFTKEIIHGTGWWDDIKDGASKAWEGAKEVGNYIKDNIPKEYVSNGLVGVATAAGTLIGNPELGLIAKPFIDKAVDYGYSGKPVRQIIQDEVEQRIPQQYKDVYSKGKQIYSKGKELYSRGKEMYSRGRKYYDDYNDEDDDDDEDDEDSYYSPPPPPRRRIKKVIKYVKQKVHEYAPQYEPKPIHNDGHAYRGTGLKMKKGSPEAKAWGEKMRAMRKNKKVGGGYNKAEQEKHEAEGYYPMQPGIPYNGAGLKKGSAEAKAWGEKMRAMRKNKKSGGGMSPEQKKQIQDAHDNPDESYKNNAIYKATHKDDDSSSDDNKYKFYTQTKNEGTGLKKRGRKRIIKGGDWMDDARDALSNAGNQIVSTITNAGNTISNGVQAGFHQVKDAVTGAVYTIKDGLTAAEEKAQIAILKGVQTTKDAITDITNTLQGKVNINTLAFYIQLASSPNPLVNEAIAELVKKLPSQADSIAFGKQLANALIHQGIPQATATICGTLAEGLFPEGGPIAGQIGAQLGQQIGKAIADKVGDETGYGIRLRHHRIYVKGGDLLNGVPLPIFTEKEKTRIRKHGREHHHKAVNGLFKGGSYAPL